MQKIKIEQAIVLEGRADKQKVSKIIDAEFILSQGFNLRDDVFQRINKLAKEKGVIVFTDPDFAGENIRKKIIENCKGKIYHAYISKKQGEKNGNIGVENASLDDIKSAIVSSGASMKEETTKININDIRDLKLSSHKDSRKLRNYLGDKLSIGYANTKEFIKRLESRNISIETIKKLLEERRD